MELNPTTDIPDIETFRHWDLCEEVQKAIADMGIVKPTPIQALTTQHVLDRKDVIAKAETGTGKTLAFGAGMISKLDSDRSTVLGLILCPTRELAQQVHDVMAVLGETRGIKTSLIVGGDPPQPQVKALQDGAQLVVGTPGRVMDLYNQGFLSFPWTEFVVLDEADEMLEIGFIDDIRKILSYTPEERTTLLFSATFPPALLKLAREHTTDPVEIATAKGVSTVDHISQNYIKVDDKDKWLCLVRLIENSDPEDVFLVFGDRRTDVDQLIRRMERMPFGTKALHGGYDQAARFRVMSAFRTGEVKCLVATDVASRGLDVKHVSHVINFGVPRDVSVYTHRIGRTGRAGAKGNAITLVNHRDAGRWRDLERQMNWAVDEMPAPDRGGRGGRGGRSDGGGRGRERGEGRRREGGRDGGRDGGRERRPRGDREERGRGRERGKRKVELEGETTSVWGASSGASPEVAATEERKPRRRSEGEREERPRRRAEGEREERPRRRRRSEGGEQGGERRERAPKRDDEGSERRERKPRRDEERRERKPRREEPAKEAPRREAAAAPGGFGAGVEEQRPEPKPKRERKPKPAPKPERKPDPTPEPPAPEPPSGGGFGAGL